MYYGLPETIEDSPFLTILHFLSVINVQQVFVPAMIYQENPSIFITTGSKQGITNPPYVPVSTSSRAVLRLIHI
jgi:hypothetical protein